MIWRAYAGLSGSIVFAIVLVAWIVGVPVEGIAKLAFNSALALLGFGVLVNVCAVALRRRRHRPRRA
jgi:hypothetical protein